MCGLVSPLRRPCVSVTGPTEETPCVHRGLSAVAVVATTTPMRTPTRTSRSSLAARRLASVADPCCLQYCTAGITAEALR